MTTNPAAAGLAAVLGKTQATPPAPEQEATQTEEQTDEVFSGKIYTCLPVQNWKIGNYKFLKGQLRLTDEKDIEQFESMLKGLHPADRVKIKTLDLSQAAARVASLGTVTRGMDNGVSKSEEVIRATPRIGTVDLGTKEGGN